MVLARCVGFALCPGGTTGNNTRRNTWVWVDDKRHCCALCKHWVLSPVSPEVVGQGRLRLGCKAPQVPMLNNSASEPHTSCFGEHSLGN